MELIINVAISISLDVFIIQGKHGKINVKCEPHQDNNHVMHPWP